MTNRLRYPYSRIPAQSALVKVRPLLPIVLEYRQRQHNILGLLDSGADVSVLPYEIGLSLGLDWQIQKLAVNLGGYLGRYEARIVVVSARVGNTSPTLLVFGWTQAPNVPVILGQANFFKRFNVHFFGADEYFEIERRSDEETPITFME
jgi:hypothetical protein